jgi:hypothetical protein
LKSAVRAPPICNCPVGLGANLLRIIFAYCPSEYH